ncbi:hypothetical protein [Streptomyces sp. MBT27]|nr:hypothetical protein [Streptomyces sp. MBT27]
MNAIARLRKIEAAGFELADLGLIEGDLEVLAEIPRGQEPPS